MDASTRVLAFATRRVEWRLYVFALLAHARQAHTHAALHVF